VQATVSAFDEATRGGAVLLDDGTELAFVADALAGTGLRLLRRGQRVRIETAGDGPARSVVRLQILTLPWPSEETAHGTGHDKGPASSAGPSS
jgi:2-phospho-L-lactate/phosphoenolpyruvate guanylyltransferase